MSIFEILENKFTKALKKVVCDLSALNAEKIIQVLTAYFFT
jgi:hypothetical protein